MNATEIKVENLVKIDEKLRNELFDCNGIITDTDTFEIAMISKYEVNLLIYGEEIEFDIKDISPVELTKEIINKTELLKGILIHDNFFSGIIKLKYNSFVGLYEFYIGDFAVCFIEHLHQLQNLFFALTNTKLTIN